MTRLILDTGPLGELCHPKRHQEITGWLKQQLFKQTEVLIPEIADYELRRELIRAGLDIGLQRLNRLNQALVYLPITTSMMLKAAELCAMRCNAVFPLFVSCWFTNAFNVSLG